MRGRGGRGRIPEGVWTRLAPPLSLFVDSSAWYAVADSSDSHNTAAKQILTREQSLITTQAIVIESWMQISRKIGAQAAERFWAGLRNGVAKVEQVTAADFDSAWETGRRFADAEFSIVDRISFAVMQRLRLDRVAAFDHHFSIFRYGPKGDRAFTVVRD